MSNKLVTEKDKIVKTLESLSNKVTTSVANNQLDKLTAVKNKIIQSLESLPNKVTISLDNQLVALNIESDVIQDIDNLKDYWSFVNDHGDKNIIALVGMVNAGKSAI